MKSSLLKYSKGIGLSLILLLFTASLLEWSIQNENPNQSASQCEEVIDIDDSADDDKLLPLLLCDEVPTFHFVPLTTVQFHAVEDPRIQNSILGNARPRCILFHQLKIAA